MCGMILYKYILAVIINIILYFINIYSSSSGREDEKELDYRWRQLQIATAQDKREKKDENLCYTFIALVIIKDIIPWQSKISAAHRRPLSTDAAFTLYNSER